MCSITLSLLFVLSSTWPSRRRNCQGGTYDYYPLPGTSSKASEWMKYDEQLVGPNFSKIRVKLAPSLVIIKLKLKAIMNLNTCRSWGVGRLGFLLLPLDNGRSFMLKSNHKAVGREQFLLFKSGRNFMFKSKHKIPSTFKE